MKHILSSVIGAVLLLYFYSVESVALLVLILVLCFAVIADKKLIFFGLRLVFR